MKTFHRALDEFLELKKNELKPYTKSGYSERIKRLKDIFADLKLEDIITEEVQDYVDDWKVLCAEKDTRIAELEDKDWYEACIKQLEEQNNRLIDTLKEKDKEIESLKRVDNIWFDSYQNELNSLRQQLTKLIIEKKQLAIQELEKVKILIQNAINFVRPNFVEVYDAINKQIKELKGEKDEV